MLRNLRFGPICTSAGLILTLALGACAGAALTPAESQTPITNTPAAATYSDRAIEDEIIYFVLPDRFENGDPSNDRGGIEGGRLNDGYDPTDYGFYHGGDLQGLTNRLDYIQGLGMTAIWLTPIFENNPVQGPEGEESSGYHGYWITDFTNVDPHIGTRDDFKTFVDAAHARGMKVYMDIITNHTADIINYRECHDPAVTGGPTFRCEYRYIGDYPWTRRASDGAAINEGFLGDDGIHQTEENFARLEEATWAYTPFVPEQFEGIKTPAWLNDTLYYHNRGDTDFVDEDSLYGDFAGLDDLNTAHPRVVEGMIDIYKDWITNYKVDGFRIDTAKHVRDEFWQSFAPAILDHAEAAGIDHFHMFGEVYVDGQKPQHLARFTTHSGLPTVLDFAFTSSARALIVDGEPGLHMDELYRADVIYDKGADTARQLPTFLGNHDMGRFAGFLREKDPEMSDDELFARVRLANALMFFGRGVPTIYYGDEQGFVSDGGDRLARENMFPSQTDLYNDNDLIATDATTAESNFDTEHPLYLAIQKFASIRTAETALRRGEQITRLAHREDSVFAFSRIDYDTGTEIVVAINAETEPRRINVAVDGRAQDFTALLGQCVIAANAPTSYTLNVPALDVVVCKSEFGAE
ncbi:MAG: alpha-amylase family glycosyl hydrolase [Pseudomonadota bacterium]